MQTMTQQSCGVLYSSQIQQEGTFTRLDLKRLLQLFDDRLSVLQLQPETLGIGDLSSESRCSHVHRWRVLIGDNVST